VTTHLPPNLEPIAIVGIGCRLPGGADSPDALWRLLCDEFDAIGPIPPSRFDAVALYDERAATPGKIMSRWGGFLDGIEDLDAAFFGIAPREAERLDPQQRLLLETSWEALEDAGMPRERVAGSNAGTYVGMWINEFEARMFADPADIDFYMTTGSGRYAASGRLAYFLDLRGPSVTVDTACSSSLVAVHLACQSLWTGECDFALAGGANVILEPTITIAYSQSRMMAPDGRCKFGDAAADGYVRSDGAAVVVLKRLALAQADGDHIYAVIRGSAVTNDGRSSGFLATPGQDGQEDMLRRAYAHAGVDPRSVQYIEAHGTGTAAGDPVELGALGSIVGAGRPADQPCLVGSIKTNVGHTEGAAGVAGLIKVALALDHREIPASLHMNQPNPDVAWTELGLEVCATRRAWRTGDAPARGGVSAFGITGTNAHVVLEAAPLAAPVAHEASPAAGVLALVISASDDAALRRLAESYLSIFVDEHTDAADVCAAAALRRSHLDHRLAVVGADAPAISEGLGAFLRGDAHPALTVDIAADAPPGVVFVFPGQGSQWAGMARELLVAEPVFSEAMQRCDRAIQAEAGWSPLHELTAVPPTARFDEIDVVQPLLFAIEVSLAAQWRAWGIEPVAVVGHSMGEVAAAYVAGALSLEQAVSVVCRRSALLRRVRGQGAMAAIELPIHEAREAIAKHAATLSIAVSNSPRSTVISGDPDAIDAVLADLRQRDVFCRLVQVDVASHSPQMDPLLDDLRLALEGIAPGSTAIPFLSTVDGRVLDGPSLEASYWARNLREPVLFADAVDQLVASGPIVFLEISPHPILVPAIEQVLQHSKHTGRALGSLRRGLPERATMLGSLVALHAGGTRVNWSAVVTEGRRAQLPGYPWQRERYWHEPVIDRAARGDRGLLGHRLGPAAEPEVVYWETDLGARDLTFLGEHVVHGSAIMPTAGFLEAALAAAAGAVGEGPFAIADMTIAEALPVAEGGARVVQLTLDGVGSDQMRFRVFSVEHEDPVTDEWRMHVDGFVRLVPGLAAIEPLAVASIVERCAEHADGDAHYQRMHERGLDYGAAFRTVQESWIGAGEAVARLQASDATPDGEAWRIVMLDGALQTALAALPAATAAQRFLPVALEQLSFAGPVRDQAELWAHAVVHSITDDRACSSVTVCDATGVAVFEARGVQLQRTGNSDRELDELMYTMQWPVADRSPTSDAHVAGDCWIIYTADGPGVDRAPDGPGVDRAPDGPGVDRAPDGPGVDLATRLSAAGAHCITVTAGDAFQPVDHDRFVVRPSSSADHQAVLRRAVAGGRRVRGVVYLWGANVREHGDELVRLAEELGCVGPIALTQALAAEFDGSVAAPRLWFVTRDAQSIDPDARQPVVAAHAVVWGTGRVIATELPWLDATLIDVSGDGDEAALFHELWAGAADRQIVLRGSERRVARLARMPQGSDPARREHADAEAYRLVVSEPGSLESLGLRVDARRSPGPDEIELRIEASGLNFIDVLKAMGVYPGLEPSSSVALGAECSGVVVAIGADVHEFAVGDQVVAITPSYSTTSMIGAFVTIPAVFAAARPARLTAAEASALPVAYVTALYALAELGHVRAGERVLIHSATGGVGLAAIQLCRHLGVDVLATAGTEAKRAYLRTLGVEHVFDSRTLAFADGVRACTGGRGVDVVLNSLTGPAIPAGLSTLAPRGRFIEIGKRDVYANARLGLELLKNNLAYLVVDIAALTEDDPHYVAGLFQRAMAMVATGALGPLPITSTPVGSATAAFRSMAQAAHTGKLVLMAADGPVVVDGPQVRPDSTYVITGGLGGLGLAVARRFVEQGARHLALLGRMRPSQRAQDAIDAMRELGACVRVLSTDVSDAGQLEAALHEVRVTMPVLRGIVHAAGSLADATIGEMDTARIHAALAPKLAGGWNVHRATLDDPLDFFVMFSSAAAVLGLAGQSNYAAGNAFLDALAHERRSIGKPALSIEWGPWAHVGLAAAATNRGDRLAARGLASVGSVEALDAFERLLDEGRPTAAVMRFDAARWIADDPQAASLLGDLVVAGAPSLVAVRRGLVERLLETPIGGRRRSVLEDAVCAELAPVLRVEAHRVDRHRPFKAMGLDSLMALELRNRLEFQTAVHLSATLAWNYPTVAILASYLAHRMNVSLDLADELVPAPASASAPVSASATQEELEALLSAELAAIDELLNAKGRSS
jgi:acyl transferase domain-containing protein/NADPH:quinone reductase-like Zn-dependent oxidoreductase/NAD(P)-dependent dehydrogenase (short-subunit alcohol dehydrogenase family)/acyl carrier protein